MRAAAIPALPGLHAALRSTLWLRLAPLLILLASVLLTVAVPPVGEFPIEDDWLYARSVQTLIQHGRLELPAWTATSLVLQACWGALFTWLFGFSHVALRASTLLLAVTAAVGCLALLREFVDSRWSLLAALLLLFNPIFVFLSYSFMTDVPFLALAAWSMFCYVRALPQLPSRLGWLVAGSALAGAAYLVRQLGAALPLAALGGLLLGFGWRVALAPRTLLAVALPFLPAFLLGAYLDEQRGPIREIGLAWMLVFWAENGLGMLGVVISRLAGAFTTLGLFTLPLLAGTVALSPWRRLARWQRWLALSMALALVLGFVIRVATFGQRVLFPHVSNILTRRGFFVFGYNGSPESLIMPDWVLGIVTLLSIFGAGLLVLAVVATVPSAAIRGPASVPLLFGLIALAQTVLYRQFFDRYLLELLPSVMLLTLLVRPQPRWGQTVALLGIALLAAWSVWWESDYLDRRSALWQAAQALVDGGVPANEIDGGYEWIGWYRGQAILAAAPNLVEPDGIGRHLENYVSDSMNMKRARWAVAYDLPQGVPESRVIASVPYGRGQRVLALQRY